MAFIDIKDPRKRDQIVQDYVNTIKELQIRTENEKAGDLQQRMELEKQYSPLIEASKESTNRITKELKNNRVKDEEKEKEDKKNEEEEDEKDEEEEEKKGRRRKRRRRDKKKI